MGELSNIYVPVVFPHKLHASMTDMGVGCATCHHANPPGRILKCSECHNSGGTIANLRQPSLKGAYHRQCLNCHREWDHQTDCAVCHAKREAGTSPQIVVDTTDIMGSLHPNIEAPDQRIYLANNSEDPLPVAFRHREHVNDFGLRCVECHRTQSCSQCHDAAEAHPPRVREDPHQDCIRCHEQETTDRCDYCHTLEQRSGFDHARITGHALAPYHADVACRQCHPGRGRMTAPDSACSTCHTADWVPDEFDHGVTGLTLDDNHNDLDCSACHPNGMGRERDCSGCHDDKRTSFPKS